MVFHLFAQQNMSNVSLLEYIVLTERIYSSHSKFATLGGSSAFHWKIFLQHVANSFSGTRDKGKTFYCVVTVYRTETETETETACFVAFECNRHCGILGLQRQLLEG